jgi:hypothetical protein
MLALVLAGMLAQTPASSIAITAEARAESLRYRIENPSSFDTPQLVPHFFEQTYDTGNLWLGARARYPLFRREAETAVSITPHVTAQADDFDTFFQPDGNLIVTGTTGNASLRAWQVSQRIVTGDARGFSFGVGYAYRRDSARFHDGVRITTMTSPPSERRELVTTREFVTSQVHQIDWFGRWSPPSSRLTLAFEVSPLSFGRLVIDLPDKYPGRLIRFNARAAVFGAEAAFRWRIAATQVEVAARASRSLPYFAGAALHVRAAGLVLRVGTR